MTLREQIKWVEDELEVEEVNGGHPALEAILKSLKELHGQTTEQPGRPA